MLEGVRSNNIDPASVIDEVLGNVTQDGIVKTGRIPTASLGVQIAQGAGAIVAKAVKATYAHLNAVIGTLAEGDWALVMLDTEHHPRGQYAKLNGVLEWMEDLTETQAVAAAAMAKQYRDEALAVAPSFWEDILVEAVAAKGDAVDQVELAADKVLAAALQADRAEVNRIASETAVANAQAVSKTLATWVALAVIPGTSAGQGAEVLDTDTGSHVDPVTAASVRNAGRFSWSISPAGWHRIGDTGLSSRPRASTANSYPSQAQRVLSIEDDVGNAAIIITDTEIRHPHIAALQNRQGVEEGYAGDTVLTIEDDAGNAAIVVGKDSFETSVLRVTSTDIEHPAFAKVKSEAQFGTANSNPLARYADFLAFAELVQIMVTGQSLGQGASASPALSNTAASFGLMFNGGTGWAPYDDANGTPTYINSRHTSLVDLREGVSSGNVETPSYGIAQMMHQLAQANGHGFGDAFGQRLLLSNAGRSGSDVAGLLAEPRWLYPIADIDFAKSLGDAAGKSVALAAMPIIQGEGDFSSSAETWKENWNLYRSRILAKIRAVYGNGHDFITPIYQMSRAGPISRAQLDLAAQDGWCLATPIYWMNKVEDGTHLTPTMSKLLGAYFGKAIYDWLWQGRRPTPLLPFNIVRLGSRIALQFNVKQGNKLAFDTAQLPLAGNYGFQILDPFGVEIALSAAVITGRDTVTLKPSATVPPGSKVRYAYNGDGTSSLVNLRSSTFGNLRDNDSQIFDPGGLALPMHQWVPSFEMEIA